MAIEMGKNARQRALKIFDEEMVKNQLLDLYKSIRGNNAKEDAKIVV